MCVEFVVHHWLITMDIWTSKGQGKGINPHTEKKQAISEKVHILCMFFMYSYIVFS